MTTTNPQMISGAPNLDIDDDDLLAKLAQCRPVVRFNIDTSDGANIKATEAKSTGLPFFIEHGPDATDRKALLKWCRGIAYTWSPRAAMRADQKEVDGEWLHLKQVGYMTTFHKYGAPVFFKPSVAEVLAQFSWETIREDGVIAFEIESDGLSCVNCVQVEGEGYHRVSTILYGWRGDES